MTFHPSEKFLVREQYDLPKGVEEIAELLVRIETTGGPIQRISLELGRPVLVWWWSSDDRSPVVPDIDAILTKSRVFLLENNAPECPEEVLAEMFHLLSAKEVFPVFWTVGPNSLIEDWLPYKRWGIAGVAKELFGYPILVVHALPPETLVLSGASTKHADVQDVTVSVKVEMEVRRVPEKCAQSVDRSGSRTEGDAERVGEVAPPEAGGVGEGGIPSAVLGWVGSEP